MFLGNINSCSDIDYSVARVKKTQYQCNNKKSLSAKGIKIRNSTRCLTSLIFAIMQTMHCSICQYDTIRQKSLTWTRKLS